MPFSGFEDFDDCKETMMQEEGHDAESAENICGALQAEAKSDHGDPDALMQALSDGAGLIADVGVDLVSGVDVPAIDSKWVAMKADDDGHDWRANVPILKADSEDKRITFAPAMIPREPDKEGDVAPTPTVEKAAHEFLSQDGGVDTDHSLIDGDGEPVESWTLKEERTFDLPGGGSETYSEGTWMLGIKWAAEPWERIKNGELTGLSIYGMAEHVDLAKDCGCMEKQPEDDPCWDGYEMVGTKTDEFGNEVPNCVPVEEASAKAFEVPFADETVVHVVYESETAAEKASEDMGLGGAVHEHTLDDMTVFMPGETHEEFVDAYMDEAEGGEVSNAKSQSGDTDKKGDTANSDMGEDSGDDSPDIDALAASVESLSEEVATIKEEVQTDKADGMEELLAEFADRLAMNDDVESDDSEELMSQLESALGKAEHGDDEDDDEEMEEAADVEKRTEDAKLDKGGDSRETAQKGIIEDSASSGTPSYAAVADELGGE